MGLLHLDNIEKIDCGFWDTHVMEALAVILSSHESWLKTAVIY